MHKLRIFVNWQRLKQKMSQQEGRTLDDQYIRQWLADAGFDPQPDGSWVVAEPDLGQLEPDEVDSVEDA
jgi:hypothetical protein